MEAPTGDMAPPFTDISTGTFWFSKKSRVPSVTMGPALWSVEKVSCFQTRGPETGVGALTVEQVEEVEFQWYYPLTRVRARNGGLPFVVHLLHFFHGPPPKRCTAA